METFCSGWNYCSSCLSNINAKTKWKFQRETQSSKTQCVITSKALLLLKKRRENIVISFKQLLTFTWKSSQKNGYYLKSSFQTWYSLKFVFSYKISLHNSIQMYYTLQRHKQNLTLVYLTGGNLKPESCIAIKLFLLFIKPPQATKNWFFPFFSFQTCKLLSQWSFTELQIHLWDPNFCIRKINKLNK